MTTTLYLVRHAEAAGNLEHRFQGHFDGQVSENGLKQLAYLEKRFESIQLDAVYSSTLARAYRTAQSVNRSAGLPIVQDERLMEINGGDFEGKCFTDLPTLYPNEFRKWEETPWDFAAPNGETMRQVYERMKNTIDEILRANAGKTIAIVSHGCAIKNYICYAAKIAFEKIDTIPWCDNTAISKITYGDDFIPHPEFLNDASHLPAEHSTLAKQDWWKKDGQAIEMLV